jgi:hypothetical protein
MLTNLALEMTYNLKLTVNAKNLSRIVKQWSPLTGHNNHKPSKGSSPCLMAGTWFVSTLARAGPVIESKTFIA